MVVPSVATGDKLGIAGGVVVGVALQRHDDGPRGRLGLCLLRLVLDFDEVGQGYGDEDADDDDDHQQFNKGETTFH